MNCRELVKFNKWLNASANLALSNNKVKNFVEYIDDYDNGGQKTKLIIHQRISPSLQPLLEEPRSIFCL